MICCEIVKDMAFDGDFSIWDFVHHIWQFHAKLLKDNDKEKEAQVILQEIDSHYKIPGKIWSTEEEAYTHYLKICGRQRLEDVRYADKIESCIDDKMRQLEWKFVALSQMIEPITMKNMPNVDEKEVNEYFIQYITELKT